jgi:hypothetical protein
MGGKLQVSRSRGAVSGVLLMLLGAWGGLIPFIGPYFHYAYTPGGAWTYTSGRLWLEVAPAVGVIVGGLMLAISSYRPTALFGAWLAAAGGAWFAAGSLIVQLGGGAGISAGTPAGGLTTRALEQLGFFTGLGIAVAFVAAIGLGRLSVVAAKDVRDVTAEEPNAHWRPTQALRDRFGGRRTATPNPTEEPQPSVPTTASQ